MATISPVALSSAGAAVTFAAASAGGDTVATGNNRATLIVRNASGSSINVTLTGVVNCSQGFTHNVVVACAAGQDTEILLPAQAYNTNGNVGVTYSSTTSITVAAIYN